MKSTPRQLRFARCFSSHDLLRLINQIITDMENQIIPDGLYQMIAEEEEWESAARQDSYDCADEDFVFSPEHTYCKHQPCGCCPMYEVCMYL
jgi:hypothetical protein